jgi:hypothetical protein
VESPLKKPPAVLVWLIRLLIPPAAREAVIGDLWERYSTPLRFFSEGVQVMPYVVASQIRRTSSVAVLALQAFALFACLGGFIPDLAGAAVPHWARAAVPTAVALLALVLRDAYRSPARRPVLSGVLDAVTTAIALGLVEAAFIWLTGAHIVASGWIFLQQGIVMGAVALPVVAILRIASGADASSRLAEGEVSDLESDYTRFARAVRWRNLAEIATCLAIIAGSVSFLLLYHPPIAPAAWATQAVFAALVLYLAVRGWARPLSAAGGQLRAQYQSELARQHRLRRVMWWWWFTPLFLGLGLNLIAPGIAKNEPVRLVLGGLAAVALAYCIAKLVGDRGRRVQQEIGALQAMG